MERLNEKLKLARKAIVTLKEVIELKDSSAITRDAAIQRFEYSFEAVWKAGQFYLRIIEGIEIGSPKGTIRGFFQIGLFNEKETQIALGMVDDRNLTSHTYNEKLAEHIFNQLPVYLRILSNWLLHMEKNIKTSNYEHNQGRKNI